ncbi:putative dCMP deaminase [Medicago truncatula]|uniref:dCMP deaminase n=1 Tax=Medicago truncatula TaxID=3880 RepID=G7JLC4_MEDTR|nr:deoxycytidylate deaminase [Medicago truncatula]AES91013.2 cytidine/deoxycytidylate deaminase family protein [Medicago truncatula]RHN63356.1 putative dCMP deaminase [Medicago truncatula]
MNSREVTLVATATAFGALASAIALHFFYRSQTHSSKTNPSQNGIVSSSSSSSSSRVRSSGDPFDPTKRKGYLSWDDYFMAIAFLSAERSKDPNRQVGACLVSQDDIILGIGYNGFPRGCSDDKLPWAKKSRTGNPLETKYPYVCHAEVNAILNTNHASAAGQRLYVTMFPCNECAKIIIQSGVSEVIYFVEKKLENSDVTYTASHKLLSLAGVKVRKHQPLMSEIHLKYEDH